MEPSAESLAPIAGVDLSLYARIVKGIAALGYDSDRLVEVAAAHGVSEVAWRLALSGWGGRIQDDRVLGARFDELYNQA